MSNCLRGWNLIGRFRHDQSGSYLVMTALLMPVLVGVVGLGTDYGIWTHAHQTMQSAAESAAISAARAAVNGNTTLTVQANAVASSYGFIDGADQATVTLNRPPKSGNYTGNATAIEVIVKKPQKPIFSALFLSQQFDISARAVALGQGDGKGCVLALNGAASGAATGQGSTTVNLKGCSLYDNSNNASALTVGGSAQINALSVSVVGGISGRSNITTTQGVYTGTLPAKDPYSTIANPTESGSVQNACNGGNGCPNGTATLSPGIYKNGMKISAGANITLSPGVYYLEGDLDIAGGATLAGTGVTLVFTHNNAGRYAGATVNGGATVNLTAPTTGTYAGIAIFGDRNMPTDTTFTFNGGATQVFTGAIYIPKGYVKYAGGSSTTDGCTQLVADTITFTGGSNFGIDCSGTGTKPLSSAVVMLVE
jgi:Putative Flp pilus-assembly TadE/G-like